MRSCALITLIITVLVAGRAGYPESRSAAATRATTPHPLSQQERETLAELSRQGGLLLARGRPDEAEHVLHKALQLNPLHERNLYNLACAKALLGKTEEAMDCLEAATLAGYADFYHIERDADLASLRDLPRYRQLLARRQEIFRHLADLELACLRRELGPEYRFRIDETSRLIFAACTDQATLDAMSQLLQAQAQVLRKELFENGLEQYVSVVLARPEDFRRILPRPNVGGFYDHQNRRLVAQRLGLVMAHEFTHALHNADLDSLGQEHPPWVAEGLATLCEIADFRPGRLIPRDSYRLGKVQEAARRDWLIPLRRLTRMDQNTFSAEAMADLAYGQAGALMHYLHELGLLRDFYTRYKQTWQADPTGVLALEETARAGLDDLQEHFRQWVLKRPRPATGTGPGGSVLGVRLAEVSDGLQITDILPDGPADRSGLRAGDLIVGIDGQDVRDLKSLVAALSARIPGQSVSLRIRRSGQYMDLAVRLGAREPARQRPDTSPIPASSQN